MELTKNKTGLKKLLLLTAFFEGGAVMATELIGAKMIGPFYGNSLYVWTAVLAITLTGLGAGYFAGGLLSEKNDPVPKLFAVLSVAAILLGLMPFISTAVMNGTMHMDLKSGITISCFVFLMPPLLCFGMTSPLAIKALTQSASDAGKTAGTVYAISTAGGILFTFLAGFYTIPEHGLKSSAYIFAGCIAIFPVYYLIRSKKTSRVATITSIFFIAFVLNFYVIADKSKAKTSFIRIIHKEDGLLGQLVIADDLTAKTRSLFVNSISQSFIDSQGQSKWTYVSKLVAECSGSSIKKVLIAGSGGGLLANELSEKGISCDVVDLDHRMKAIAAYFSKPVDNFIEDDIRHYINTSTTKHDAIILDISQGENQPTYVYTLESFSKLRKLIKDDGRLYIHFPSVFHRDMLTSVSSIAETMKAAGFRTVLLNTPLNENKSSEVIFAGFINLKPDMSSERYTAADFKYHIILTDDKPVLDQLHDETLSLLRKEGITMVTQTLLKEGYSIF